MTSLAVCWAVFPLLFLALAGGTGLLLEQAAGVRLPGALVCPAGFAGMLVAGSLTTASDRTAQLTVPVIVVLSVLGFGFAWPWRPRPDWWAVAAASGVYLVYAAPIVASGSATFAGYISLDDTATWFAFADNALQHGRTLSALAPSSYFAVLADNTTYPIGTFVPLGVAHILTGQDEAWLFQPYLAFLASLLSVCVYQLAGLLVRRRSLRALVAFVAAQPAVLYGYAFWSGIKELTVALLVALVSALAALELERRFRLRGELVLAVAAAALLACLSALAAVWLAGLVVFVCLAARAHGVRRAAISAAVAAGCVLLLSVPSLALSVRFVRGANASDSGNGALGNLFHPLSVLQLAGIWPAGDFRGRPSQMTVTYVLVAVVCAAAVYAMVVAVRRGVFRLPLYLAAALGGSVLVAAFDKAGHGSPWLDAKALASAAPALLAAGLAGAVILCEGRRSFPAGVAAVALIVAGVGWSNALAYGHVWAAPRAQLAELERIGERFAGDGPALMTEYQPYGVRHFLRTLDPEGASERRMRPVSLRAGGVLDKAQYADLDAFVLADVLVYRTLVLRHSPFASRPPSLYAPVWNGRFYEVWQQQPSPRLLEHLPLGNDSDPEAMPACADVQRLAGEAAAASGLVVAAAGRPAPVVVDLAAGVLPAGWLPGKDPGTVLPAGSGTVAEQFVLPASRQLALMVGGSFRGQVTLLVDGRRVGAARGQLEETAQLVPLGAVRLGAGEHELVLVYQGPSWRPGSRGQPFLLGPLVVGEPATAARLVRVAPAQATSLCGRLLDWVEAVAPS